MLSTQQRIDRKRQAVPVLYLKLFDRCISGDASPRQAIKLHCLECWGYVRTETALCDNVSCPLFAYRPYQTPQGGREDDLSAVESTI